MKKTLLILSAIAVTGTAFVFAQEEGERPTPRGERGERGGRGGGGMFANAPLLKALGIAEDGSITLPTTPEAKEAMLAAIAKCDKDGDGKISRIEMFGERRRGGGGGGGARPAGGEGRGGAGAEGGERPKRPASE